MTTLLLRAKRFISRRGSDSAPSSTPRIRAVSATRSLIATAAALGLCALVFVLSFEVWNYIAIPYSNPAQIVGPLSEQRFHPLNNVLRFLVVVLAPTLTWLLLFAYKYRSLWTVWPGRHWDSCPVDDEWAYRAALIGIGCVAVVQCIGLFANDFSVWTAGLFDGGEDLVPAAVYRDTGRIWTGAVFIHGAIPNVFKHYLGWRLTGVQSIGAVVVCNLAWSMAWCIGWAAWLAAAAALVRRSGGPLLATAVVTVLSTVLYALNERSFLMNYREAGFFLVVALLTAGLAWRRTWVVVGAGALSVMGLAAHIDRAFYAIAISGVGLSFNWLTSPDRREARRLVLGYGAGLLIGGLVFLAMFGPTETGAFARTTLFWIRYKDYLDSFIYPLPLELRGLEVANVNWTYLAGIARAAAALLGFVALLPFYRRRGLHGLATVHAMIAAAGIIYYRNALGRSDFGHLWYSMGPAVLGTAMIGVGLSAWLGKRGERLAAAGGLLALGAIIALHAVSVVAARDQILRAPERVRHLIYQPDEAFIESGVKEEVPQMKALFEREACAFVFPNAPGWYYFLKKPPCTRFYVTWFASPLVFQREVVRDLETKRPRLIVYETGRWFDNVDEIRQGDRLPLLNSFLLQHYEAAFNVGRNVVYRLRE